MVLFRIAKCRVLVHEIFPPDAAVFEEVMTCVFVKVVVGSRVVLKSLDVDVDEATTFESLLKQVIDDEGLEIEVKREVIVTMTADSSMSLLSPGRVIRDHRATVASRIAAGRFIEYRVAPPPETPKPTPEEEEAERAMKRTAT